MYNRAEYAPQRRQMLQFWADYIERRTTSGHVLIGRFKRVALPRQRDMLQWWANVVNARVKNSLGNAAR